MTAVNGSSPWYCGINWSRAHPLIVGITRRLAVLAIAVSLLRVRCSFSCIKHHLRDASLIIGLHAVIHACYVRTWMGARVRVRLVRCIVISSRFTDARGWYSRHSCRSVIIRDVYVACRNVERRWKRYACKFILCNFYELSSACDTCDTTCPERNKSIPRFTLIARIS